MKNLKRYAVSAYQVALLAAMPLVPLAAYGLMTGSAPQGAESFVLLTVLFGLAVDGQAKTANAPVARVKE